MDLRACPFCGCPGVQSMDANPVSATEAWGECVGCGARGPRRFIHKYSSFEKSMESSREAWNTRADEAIRREVIEDFIDILEMKADNSTSLLASTPTTQQ